MPLAESQRREASPEGAQKTLRGLSPARIAALIREVLPEMTLVIEGRRAALIEPPPPLVTALGIEVQAVTPFRYVVAKARIKRLDAAAKVRVPLTNKFLQTRARKKGQNATELLRPIEINGEPYLLQEVIFSRNESCRFVTPVAVDLAGMAKRVVSETQPESQRVFVRLLLTEYGNGGIVDLESGRALVFHKPFPEGEKEFTVNIGLCEPDWEKGHRNLRDLQPEISEKKREAREADRDAN